MSIDGAESWPCPAVDGGGNILSTTAELQSRVGCGFCAQSMGNELRLSGSAVVAGEPGRTGRACWRASPPATAPPSAPSTSAPPRNYSPVFAVSCAVNAAAEDAVQEAYVRIWRRAGDFDAAIASPIAWMTTIARHAAIDIARRGAERVSAASADDRRRVGRAPGRAAGGRRSACLRTPRRLPRQARGRPARHGAARLLLRLEPRGTRRPLRPAGGDGEDGLEAKPHRVEGMPRWRTDRDEIDALAAEYVLGTLDADERRAAEARVAADPAFRAAVAAWESACSRSPTPRAGRAARRHLRPHPVAHRRRVGRAAGRRQRRRAPPLRPPLAHRLGDRRRRRRRAGRRRRRRPHAAAPQTEFVAVLTPDGGAPAFVRPSIRSRTRSRSAASPTPRRPTRATNCGRSSPTPRRSRSASSSRRASRATLPYDAERPGLRRSASSRRAARRPAMRRPARSSSPGR